MVQSKSGRVDLAFKGRIDAGDAARGLNEASILPLGTSSGVPFFLDGSRAMNWNERLELGMVDENEQARERGCRQECESGPG